MNIQQLQYFLSICETHSLTKSAGLLYMTQPALSKSVATLEKELNTLFFTKNNSGVRLTPSGEIFMIFAQNTLNELNEIKREMDRMQKGETQALNIGFTQTMDSLAMSKFCTDFYDIFPELKNASSLLLQQFVSTQELAEALITAKVSYAFMPNKSFITKLKNDGFIDFEIIQKGRMVLYADLKNPLVQFDQIDSADLHDETIIVNNEESFDIGLSMQSYNRFMLVKSDNTMIFDMVARGMGIFFSGDNLNYDKNKIKKIALCGEQNSFDIIMAWEKKKPCCIVAKKFKKYILDDTKDFSKYIFGDINLQNYH